MDGSDLKSSLTYPNGLTASWTYGNRGELFEVNNASPTGTVSRYVYTYDAAGRRVACAKSGSAFTTPDTYDYLYNTRSELTNATAAVDSDYRYAYDFDQIGNRKTSAERGVQSAEYMSNELNQYTNIEYSAVSPATCHLSPTYDADGNQTLVKTATGIWRVTYNGENRPVRWEQGPTVITMSFDRMGRRVTKDDQRFFYNGYLQIANHHSSTSTSTSHFNYYIWDPTEPVATRPLAWKRGTSVAYYTHDGNKNVSEVTASNNDVSAHYEYAPFGALTVSRGESAAANPWRFSSEYAEDETATVYYNYRHYEPVTGRWMSRDPIEDIASLTGAYDYVANSPLGDFDWIGCISLSEFVIKYVNSSLGVDFSIPLLGNGIPLPWIPGCPRAQVHIVVSGEMRWCCKDSGRDQYFKGTIGLEAYLVWGYGKKRPYKGHDRNKPDPERPGHKMKEHDDHPKDSGYRSRTGHFDGNVGKLKDCPQKGFHWDELTGAIFLRGSVGCGFAGLQANVQINVAENMSLESLVSGSWSLAHGIYGATVEFGGGGYGNWTYMQ